MIPRYLRRTSIELHCACVVDIYHLSAVVIKHCAKNQSVFIRIVRFIRMHFGHLPDAVNGRTLEATQKRACSCVEMYLFTRDGMERKKCGSTDII